MEHIIKDLKMIPGVVGCFLYSYPKGIRANNLPTIFKPAKLTEIGQIVRKMVDSCEKGFSDISGIYLYFEESIVIIRYADADLLLIVLCDPGMNPNLLTMSLNIVMGELNNPTAPPDIQPEPPPKQERKGVSAESVLLNSPFAKQLNEIKTGLIKIVGPIGEIIFLDALEEWSEIDEPSQQSIKALVKILLNEIGDIDMGNKFKLTISKVIESLKK